MEEHFQTLLTIWDDYYSVLPFRWKYESEQGQKIIDKIKQFNYHFVDEKVFFKGMIDDISRVVYSYKYDDRFCYTYDEDNPYIYDKQLNSCYRIKLYLLHL